MVLAKTLWDTPHYPSVFSEGLQVDQDVIEVDAYQAFHDDVLENVIHHGLEGCWAIGETKEHHQGFKQPSGSLEGGLPLVTLSDLDVIVPPSNIQLDEVLHSLELVYELWNKRNQIMILDGHCI